MIPKLIVLLLCSTWLTIAQAQDSTAVCLPQDYLTKVGERTGHLSDKLDKKSERTLHDFQKTEARIYKKLARIDSTKAAQFLHASKEQYSRLQQKLSSNKELTQYIPFLDTLKTSLNFLSANNGLLGKAKDADRQLTTTLSKVKDLEQELAKAESIKQFLNERRAQLKDQLVNLPFAKDLKKLNKQAYYYSAQVQEYKQVLSDPKQLERKAMELLSKTKAFQEFMREHSQLASLFRLPGGDNGDPSVALQGLQTRAQVTSLIQSRVGAGGTQQLRDNMQAAQAQLSELKSKLAQYSSGSYGNSSDVEQPDFKPNGQKTRSFKDRLEVGSNMQSQRARYFFPVTSDIGLSLGYKLNDNSVVGVGAAYKLGLGSGWQHIALSHQGIGLRSFVDYRLRGSLYLSGGYEQNYRSAITTISQLEDQSAWQTSGLVGVSKKYKVSKKLKGEMKLLWDFLSYQQVPKTQAILFRIGYTLK